MDYEPLCRSHNQFHNLRTASLSCTIIYYHHYHFYSSTTHCFAVSQLFGALLVRDNIVFRDSWVVNGWIIHYLGLEGLQDACVN